MLLTPGRMHNVVCFVPCSPPTVVADAAVHVRTRRLRSTAVAQLELHVAGHQEPRAAPLPAHSHAHRRAGSAGRSIDQLPILHTTSSSSCETSAKVRLEASHDWIQRSGVKEGQDTSQKQGVADDSIRAAVIISDTTAGLSSVLRPPLQHTCLSSVNKGSAAR